MGIIRLNKFNLIACGCDTKIEGFTLRFAKVCDIALILEFIKQRK
jgi:hypothetical protein